MKPHFRLGLLIAVGLSGLIGVGSIAAQGEPPALVELLTERSIGEAPTDVHLTPDRSTVTLAQSGTISGTVTDASGMPLGNIPVDIGEGGYATCTNPDGTYTLTGLPLDTDLYVYAGGNYTWCGGPTNYIKEYWNEKPLLQDATAVVLTPDSKDVTGINFTLGEGGSIAGTVVDQNSGLPLGNVLVQIFIENGDRVELSMTSVCTDANGNYSIDGIPLYEPLFIDAGWEICGSPPVQIYVREFWNDTPFLNNATRITLTSSTPDLAGIDFSLEEGVLISGTVTDEITGLPIETIAVFVDPNYSAGDCTRTGGYYQLVVPYNTDVTLHSGGYPDCGVPHDYLLEYWDNAEDPSSATVLNSSGPDIPNINFALTASNTISGTVRNGDGTAPLSDAYVCVQEYSSEQWYGCWDVNPDGTYVIGGMPPGIYRAESGGPNLARELYNELPYYGDHNNATPISITTLSDTPGIDFTLEPGGTISGTVTDANGTPLGNILVDTAPWGGFGRCTNPDGTFTLEELPLDTALYVYAGGSDHRCDGGPTNYQPEYWNEVGNLDGATAIMLTTGHEDATGIVFTLEIED